MRVLLISTYDMGRQPFGLASPAAWLRAAGFEVDCLDLGVEALDPGRAHDAGLIAFHLPMHAATRNAARTLPVLRAAHPAARYAAFGLYAAMNGDHLRDLGVEFVIGGEFEAALVELARQIDTAAPGAVIAAPVSIVSHERLTFVAPDRSGLPGLERYAHLHLADGSVHPVGYTEATRGCKHLCRHCPIVPVYEGRFRVVPREVVLEDVRRQVAAGARHITFGDPDFWNGIGHAIPIVRALHAEHPHVGYDVTIKIEHLLKHREHLATLRETGCRFVTSAVESVDDRILERLAKGHTRADFVHALELCRTADLPIQPTFVAFTPWITVDGYRRLLTDLATLGLIDDVPPVQLAIRLLIPAGSKLLELEDVREVVGPFDPAALVHPWRHPEPAVDELQAAVEACVRAGIARGAGRREIFELVWRLAHASPSQSIRGTMIPLPIEALELRHPPIPFLDEPWYC